MQKGDLSLTNSESTLVNIINSLIFSIKLKLYLKILCFFVEVSGPMMLNDAGATCLILQVLRKFPENISELNIYFRRKEGNVLFNDALNTFLFTIIWRSTYGKGPLR